MKLKRSLEVALVKTLARGNIDESDGYGCQRKEYGCLETHGNVMLYTIAPGGAR